jgi:hypothetical protein
MANVKLSQIAPSPSNVDAFTQFVSVEGGNTDYLFTPNQLINGMALQRLSATDQILTGGWNVTPHAYATGSVTIDCGLSPLQLISNTGAFTINAPGNDGQTILQVTNGSGAGTITFNGFTIGNNVGDALTTVNGNVFSIFIWRINGLSSYYVIAQQSGASAGPQITPVTSTVSETGHIMKASGGTIYGAYAVNLSNVSGFLVLLDSPTIPADGAITPLAVAPIAPTGVAGTQGSFSTIPTSTGIVAVLTSATTPFTKTTNSGLTGYISCQFQ